MSPRTRNHPRLWAALALAGALVPSAWMLAPSAELALGGALLVAVLAVGGMVVRPAGWATWLVAVAGLGLAALLGWAGLTLARIEADWPAEREARVTRASDQLAGSLDAAFDALDTLAVQATAAAALPREAAFDLLGALVPTTGPEVGLALLDRAGVPVAWAGTHHRVPMGDGPLVGTRADGLFLALDLRHLTPDGGAVVATMLMWASPAVPGGERSLASEFGRRTGVDLEVYAPGLAPPGPDLFDYALPDDTDPDGRRVLFSVVPVPPEQASAEAGVVRRVRPWLLALAAVLCLGVVAAGAAGRRLPAIPALGVLGLAAVGTGEGRPVQAAIVAAMAALVLLLAWLHARRGPRWLAGLLLLGAPAVLLGMTTMLQPPTVEGGAWRWVGWQVALVLSGALPALAACALLRNPSGTPWRTWPLLASVLVSVVVLFAGLASWHPGSGPASAWVLAWTAAMLPLLWPLGARARVAGVAVALGAAAALLAWRAYQDERLALATADLASLGVGTDPLESAALEAAVLRLARAPVPDSPTALFLRWSRDPLAQTGRPVVLGTWDTTGAPVAMLALDSLDVDLAVLGGFAAALREGDPPALTRLVQSPGVHHVALARDGARVSLLVVGPPTGLIRRTRLGRLLLPTRKTADGYALSLGPPQADLASASEEVVARRRGWSVRAERQVVLPEGTRLAAATLDLRGPWPIGIRVLLLLALHTGLLLVLGVVADWLVSGTGAWARFWAGRRSFRVRLGAALALFFLVPAVIFTAWALARLADDTRRQRDALTEQVLREAAPGAGAILRGPDRDVPVGLTELGGELDGELALYSGGVFLATSAPILRDIGVLPPLLEPDAFQVLAAGTDVDLVRARTGSHAEGRIGYRVVQAGSPATLGVVATPQVADDGRLRREQLDLALALMAAALLGAVAAGVGAGAVARALARPVRELREAAAEIGAGREPKLPASAPPVEFTPVYSAMRTLGADVRASREALEAARARTAAVLRTVATGVVALDDRGRVLLANPRAEELLGHALPEGEAPAVPLPRGGAPASEFERAGRHLRAEVARLPGDGTGVVVAIHDVTEAGRAARVLAWGEMARQVAHEIKNPLTPLRLGVQHLQRAWRRGADGYGEVLDDTTGRILTEIDRLDTIARVFSRFGAPGEVAGPLEPVDVLAVAEEVAALYRLAEDGAVLRVEGTPGALVQARRDELKEVLVNLLENSRNAGAGEIVIGVARRAVTVRDDGRGIPAADIPRVFEPRFSTTTSGSGLGLAIVRRLVEGWGATIALESVVGRGTEVTVRFGTARDPHPPPGEQTP